MQARKRDEINDEAIMFQFGTILPQPVNPWNATGTKWARITYLHRFRVCSPLHVDSNPVVVWHMQVIFIINPQQEAKRLIFAVCFMTELLITRRGKMGLFVSNWNAA